MTTHFSVAMLRVSRSDNSLCTLKPVDHGEEKHSRLCRARSIATLLTAIILGQCSH